MILLTDLTELLEGRLLLLVSSRLSADLNVREGTLEALAVSLPTEEGTASLQ